MNTFESTIISKYKECLATAERFYGMDFSSLKKQVVFNLNGSTAGQYVRENGIHIFRVNTILAENNLQEYLNDTIPHEVAHFVARLKYGVEIKSHGSEWQSVMIYCFKLNPNRCHHYDTKEVKSKNVVKRHHYICSECGNKTHFSTTSHNRIQDGTKTYRYSQCYHNIKLTDYKESKEYGVK